MRAPERGSAVIPALAMLLLLAAVASLGLAAGGADLLLATRATRERAAAYAAESALATAVAAAGSPGAVDAAAFAAPWPAPQPAVRRWDDGGWRCSSRLVPLPDAADADGNPATTVVLYDRSFGYAGAPRAAGGWPVFQVVAGAEGGGARAAVVAEVTPVACAPSASAAWTAGGSLAIAGDARVSGIAPTGEGADAPAIAARGMVLLADGAAADGLRGEDGRAVAIDPGLALPDDPLAVLNAGPTLRRLDDLPPPPADGPLAGLAWSRGDHAGPLDGEGVLVVHNPGFDPVRFEASRLAIEEGVRTAAWDPSYSHLDPAHRPARLEVVRGGSFRGVIVADAVGACGAPLELRGALVTLSRSPLAVRAAMPLRIERSPAAVARAGRGPLRHLLAFRPLPAIEGRLP